MQFERPLPLRRCMTSRLKQRSQLWTTGLLSPVTTDEVNRLISEAPNKTCQLDPVPTWLLKKNARTAGSINHCVMLITGCFPSEFKLAIVRPLLKKSGLDATDLKNYRPVSSLSFLSTLLDREGGAKSITGLPSQQSAYMYLQRHSTETEVLKVYNDLLLAADSELIPAVWLLDLTAAFDTDRPWFTSTRFGAAVWSTQCHSALVQVLPVRQIISCLVWWCCLENRLRRLFCSSGVST